MPTYRERGTRVFEWPCAEPIDKPYLVDDQGHPWWFDHYGDDDTGVWPGWFSPFVTPTTCRWADIFHVHDVFALTEIDHETAEELVCDLTGS